MPPNTASQTPNQEFQGIISAKQAEALATAQTPHDQAGLIDLCGTLRIVPPKTSGGFFCICRR